MVMKDNFDEINDERVAINLSEKKINIFNEQKMLKLADLRKEIFETIFDNYTEYQKNLWINEGIKCEILKPGSLDWDMGKVRLKLTIEFCSDRVESPLDDIRQEINRHN
jgi:hypothetical protein